MMKRPKQVTLLRDVWRQVRLTRVNRSLCQSSVSQALLSKPKSPRLHNNNNNNSLQLVVESNARQEKSCSHATPRTRSVLNAHTRQGKCLI